MASIPASQPTRCRFFLGMLLLGITALSPLIPTTVAGEHPVKAREFIHTPIHSAAAGKTIPVGITIAEPQDIVVVRLYFKTMAASSYLFLPMTPTGKNFFEAALPPVRNNTKGIDYILLFQDNLAKIHKTKPFRLLIQNDHTTLGPSPDSAAEVFAEEPLLRPMENDFAIPLRLVITEHPMLAKAAELPYQLLAAQGPKDKNPLASLPDLGLSSFSINIGGIGFTYRSSGGH